MEYMLIAQRAPVRKLILHNLMGYKPTDEDTGQEAHHGQEQLARHEIKQVEEGLAKQ